MHAKLQMINTNVPTSMATELAAQSASNSFTVIALGTKEATPVDLHTSFSKFIEHHYHEGTSAYSEETTIICDARNKMRESSCSIAGRNSILDYFGKLLQAEHRFFQEDKCNSLVFNWYDSLDGKPLASKSIRLEKASVLYNLAAMSSQLAATSDCSSADGLEDAIDHFQDAAGILQYIHEENFFKLAVSTDLARSNVSALSLLMLAQAQECIWHARMLSFKASDMEEDARPDGFEAAAVAEWYTSCREALTESLVSQLPKQWVATVHTKEILFRAIADWHAGSTEMVHSSKKRSFAGLARVVRARQRFAEAYGSYKSNKLDKRIGQMAKEFLEVVDLVIGRVNSDVVAKLALTLNKISNVGGKAVRWATGVCSLIDDCTLADDMFARMGPVYFFNSMCALVERRTHTVPISVERNYGLILSGGNPVRIADISYGSPASTTGLLAGDYLIELNGVDVRGMVTTEVSELLAKLFIAGKDLEVIVVVNYDMQNFEELINPENSKGSQIVSKMLPMPTAWSCQKFSLHGKLSKDLLGMASC
jgi:hypothetical protein